MNPLKIETFTKNSNKNCEFFKNRLCYLSQNIFFANPLLSASFWDREDFINKKLRNEAKKLKRETGGAL